MASRLMPICGHLRSIGEEKVVHVCIRQRDHEQDDGTNHLLVPWVDYVRQRAERAEGSPDFDARPWWMDTLAEAVQAMERQNFREAIEQQRADPNRVPPRPPLPAEDDPSHVKADKWRAREEWDSTYGEQHRPQTVPTLGGDPDLQPGYTPPGMEPTGRACEATRQIPPHPAPGTRAMLQRCGNLVVPGSEHQHGNWQDMGLAPEPAPGVVPGSRATGETWQQVTEEAPDAWRPPDEGDRAATPPPGGPIPGDVSGEQLSPPGRKAGQGSKEIKFQPPARGEGGRPVATVGEVKAVAARMMEEFHTLRAQADEARNIVNRLGGEAQHTLTDSSMETAQAVIACTHGAETALDDVIANVGNAIENLERFIATA